jgi:flagellar motor protein MotB
MKDNLHDKLGNFESPYDFSGTEWQGLEARLDKQKLWKRGLLAGLGGLLLLAFMGSNIALWRQNQALTQRLSAIESAQSTVEKTSTITVLGQTDTVVKQTILYQYDTIYRKITVVQEPFLTPELSSKTVKTLPDFSTALQTVPITNLDNNRIENTLDKSIKATKGTPQYSDEKMPENENNPLEIKEKQTILVTDTPSNQKEIIALRPDLAAVDTTASALVVTAEKPVKKDSIALKMPPSDSLDIVKKENKEDKKIADKTEKKHSKYAFKMLPIYLGATVDLPIWSSSSAIGQNANEYGLKAEVVATDRVRFFAEMSYMKNSESKSTDLSTLPNEISRPNVESSFAFKYWEMSDLTSINYMAGVQYRLGKNDKLRPYLAVAFNGTTILPFEVDFEYKDKVTGLEKSYNKEFDKTITRLNRIYTGVGVHWQPFSKGQLSAETYLTTPLNGDKTLTPMEVGLKIGLFYFIR